ncbi:hypothetical protein H4R18_001161 [Coemansia javaensis]|uniref:Uncharacterized protein n=1 Tax=Coemansia javaensis TaxID=2761396 RepID=A0A9W8HHW7_9FUNG|nr:hypothetical protein H4R18_001161 [Coemansia javaensis]
MQHDVPHDILYNVFRQHVLRADSAKAAFKAGLPLLAVCQKWRRIAAPVVYGCMFVQHRDHADRSCGNSSSSSTSSSEGASGRTTTNINLIRAAGCGEAVWRVGIDVHFAATPLGGFRAAARLMGPAGGCWAGVRLLEIAVHPGQTAGYTASPDLAASAAALLVLKEIADMMLGVRVLALGGGSTHYSQVGDLYGHLAAHYAGRVLALSCRHPFAIPADQPFACLEAATVDYDHEVSHVIPRISTAQLARLSILNTPPNHPWAPFDDGLDAEAIAFPRLRTLRLRYDTICAQPVKGCPSWRPRELRFPSLDVAEIRCPAAACPALQWAVLPRRMHALSISLQRGAFQRLAQRPLPDVRHLTLGIYEGGCSDDTFLADTNCIFARAHKSETRALNIYDYTLQVRPCDLVGAALTSLMVTAPVPASAVLELLTGLPGLKSLALRALVADSVDPRIALPVPGACLRVQPLGTAVSSLDIDIEPDQDPHGPPALVSKYLLLSIPALSTFTARWADRHDLAVFACAYAPQYPHLATVDYVLEEDDDCSYDSDE